MPVPHSRFWQELTTKEFAALDAERTIAVLPVGAVEQHGPHLSVWVDSAINAGILARAVPLIPDPMPVLILPMLPIGKSDEHEAFPGTLSLSAETLIRVWTEVGQSVHRAGIRKLVLYNSHGGQPQIMDIVARDLRVRLKMFVVTCSWFSPGLPDGLFPPSEVVHGIHGGGIETSMMLHLRPDLVRKAERRKFDSLSIEMEQEFKYLTPEGKVGFGWQTQDLNLFGACGDATDADADRGAKLVDHAARCLVELLSEVDRFPLDALRDRV
ncbi:creatininase family protein [Skermanella pratensis]|uniref:creatininase family protein n=1 Tax=Skermanella pratensis TaxID=2233999 RepID=UPI0013013133|nr:creatininase family protein [Skermanella pratensis]